MKTVDVHVRVTMEDSCQAALDGQGWALASRATGVKAAIRTAQIIGLQVVPTSPLPDPTILGLRLSGYSAVQTALDAALPGGANNWSPRPFPSNPTSWNNAMNQAISHVNASITADYSIELDSARYIQIKDINGNIIGHATVGRIMNRDGTSVSPTTDSNYGDIIGLMTITIGLTS